MKATSKSNPGAGTSPLTFLCVALVCLLVLSPRLTEAHAQSEHVAFINVNVLPMDAERVLSNQTVLIREDRIVAIGPVAHINVPEGSVKIDGAGKFLLPGLGEMHGHNPPPDSSEETIERIYFLFAANGVTTVRSMLGWPGQLELRDKVNRGEMFGPTLYLAGPSFSGQTVHSPAQAEQRVREQKDEGWDLLKVHPGLRREAYDAMARTARELDINFAGHIPADVGLAHAIEMGQETIDHLDGYIEYLDGESGELDPKRLEQAVRLTRAAGVGVVPTMVLWETIIGAADLEQMLQFEELKFVPPKEVAQWKEIHERRVSRPGFNQARAQQIAANRKVLLKALNDGGVQILFGTDAPQQFSVPGFSIHREMKAMIEAGLAPYEILRSATRDVGEYLKDKDHFGTITPGARADLILLEANPLDEIAHVARRAGVMVRGQWLPESEIQARLGEITASLKD